MVNEPVTGRDFLPEGEERRPSLVNGHNNLEFTITFSEPVLDSPSLRIKNKDDDGWQRSFYIYDLQTGDRVDFKYDLQTGRREGDEVVPVADKQAINQDTFRPNTFGGGERLMVVRVRGSGKGDSFLRACVLDVKTSEIIWTGEPQKYQKEGENVEGYDIIERYIGEPVPGEADALFMFTEEHGPSIIRRVSPKNQ